MGPFVYNTLTEDATFDDSMQGLREQILGKSHEPLCPSKPTLIPTAENAVFHYPSIVDTYRLSEDGHRNPKPTEAFKIVTVAIVSKPGDVGVNGGSRVRAMLVTGGGHRGASKQIGLRQGDGAVD